MKMPGVLALGGTLVLLASPLRPQGAPAPGLRLFGSMASTDTHLVDTRGVIVHTWPSSFRPGLGVYLLDDGSLLRAIKIAGGAGGGGGVQRMAFDGSLLWDYRYSGPGTINHHDIEPLPNGNVLLIAWEEKSAAEAIAAGRNPALLSASILRADQIVEIQPTGPTSGAVVWEWHVLDHLIQDFNPSRANFGSVASHPELVDFNYPPDPESSDDWNHVNGIDYDPLSDRILISSHNQDEIWVIDHSTSSAEAAGHSGGRWGKGGDLLYRWGNPAVYRAGTTGDQMLFGQHAPTFIPPGFPGAGHILVFNNQFTSRASAVFELDPPLDASGRFVLGAGGRYGPVGPLWIYTDPSFFSPLISSAERLANGNTLICSGAQRWLFEVDASGQRVWEYRAGGGYIFHTHYYERSLWADRSTLSAAGGGGVRLDLLAGSDHAATTYLVLGSASGTAPGLSLDGVILPLNPDPFLEFTLLNPGAAPILGTTLGTLDARGAARAAFNLPAGVLAPGPAGLQLHFAFAALEPVALRAVATSNAVPLRIVP